MFFKKYKIKKTQETSKLLPYTLWVLGIFLIFFLWVKAVDKVNTIDFKFTEFAPKYISWLSWTGTTLEEENNETLNILILWRWGGDHDAPDLTDSIILASIDFKKDIITMFSIPRDLYVRYPDNSKRTGKINRIYWDYKYLNSPEVWIEKISSKVSEITGQKIDYYVNVDFEWFIEIVDILWWVDVTLEENLVDNEYPTPNGGWTTFILRKGTWTLDGEVALKYARSRHSTSDFDRSLRQQQILSGIKDKVLDLGYLKDNKKIRELYESLQKNIETNIDLSTILKLALDTKTWGDKKIISFNLNDTCFPWSTICSTGGFLYVPLRDFFWGQSVLLIEWTDVTQLSNYYVLEPYMDAIFEKQTMYTSPVSRKIYNATWESWLASWLNETLKKYGLSVDEQDWFWNITEKKFEKSVLLYNGINEENETLLFLRDTLGFETQKTSEPMFSDNGTSIEIVLWEDFVPIEYLELNTQ